MKTAEMIEVLKAKEQGNAVQCKAKDQVDDYVDCFHVDFDFQEWDYRIKPVPREWWIRFEKANDGSVHGYWFQCEPDHVSAILVREVL